MIQKGNKKMSKKKPRFEFRTFARELGFIERRMRELSPVERIRESSEIYIMSAVNNKNNTKIRNDKMDIKVFVMEKDGLEQWNPRMKGTFPMSAEQIQSEVFPAFGVKSPVFKRDAYTLDQFLKQIIHPHKDLLPVFVQKRRFAFTINDCIAEVADVYINGAKIRTANLESVDTKAILEGMKMVGLESYKNINYLMAIKKVTGLEQGVIPY
ncbi:MAG: hypothetical protein CSA81_11905 [Acidobacteria bacterium]|nr:MAG: hypothetical protein CSA81_11905 [Acidobacteriota bacterium]